MMIDNANDIMDLTVPPANHLEYLAGKRKGQQSIRINKQYRICFVLKNRNEFYDVVTEFRDLVPSGQADQPLPVDMAVI